MMTILTILHKRNTKRQLFKGTLTNLERPVLGKLN